MNLRLISSVTHVLILTATSFAQLANLYPHDIGIENDPDVLFVEKFDDALTSVTSRYDEIVNAAGMSLDSDVPPGSKDPYSLKMTNIGGQNNGGHLYRRFVPGFDSTVYLRYYVKYPSISRGYIHHEGVWIGGYNPATPWPYPRAGTCGLGDKRISIAYEPVGVDKMNTYMYWGDMRNDPNGKCWGNVMIRGSAVEEPVPYDDWLCVEIMVKLNDPVTAYNGELQIWHNGKEVGHWGPGFPNGSWTWDKFIKSDSAQPFEGFRWRTDPKLDLNYIWIEYYDDTSPAGVSHYIKYDHIVMARKRIGPLFTDASVSRSERDPIIMHPNPASDRLLIHCSGTDKTNVTFYSLLGESIRRLTVEDRSELDISFLPRGLYIVEVLTGNTITRQKLIVQ